MRYRLAASMLMVVLLLLSAINIPAAPVPDPSAVLDIGPPPKDMTAKEYCKQEIDGLKHPVGALMRVRYIPEMKKKPSAAHLNEKEVGSWLVKNIRIKVEEDGRRLRFTFRAGNREEQVAILNALLRFYTGDVKQEIKTHEEALRPYEERAGRCAKLAKEERDPDKRAHWKKLEEDEKAPVASVRAEVDRMKQISVIKWAK